MLPGGAVSEWLCGGRNSICGGESERVRAVIRVVGFFINCVKAMWDECFVGS